MEMQDRYREISVKQLGFFTWASPSRIEGEPIVKEQIAENGQVEIGIHIRSNLLREFYVDFI